MFRRLCVGGWSYGGMLTDHVIVSDHRFKAAITGASAVLCVSIQIEAAYMICQTRLTAVLDPSLSWHPSIYTQVGLFTKPGPVLWCVCVRYRASYGHDQYQLPYEETLAFNPGSFASDFAWMVYRPCAKMEAERSSLS